MALKLKIRIAVALYLITSFAVAGFGQSGRLREPSGGQKQGDKETVRLRAEEVLLPVSVRTDSGKLPTHLDRSDFIVLEDDKRQQITAVMRTPANILLMIDASGEVGANKDTSLNRQLALKIIDSLGDRDRAAIITYADKITLLSPWTSDKEALRHAVNWKFKPGFQAHFYDGLLYGAEEVMTKVSGRRSVVLLTDGVDSFKASMFEEALAALHRARAMVYVVSHTAMLISDLKPRYFNPLAWYEMIDPKVRARYAPLRRYIRDLEAAEITLKGLAEETGGAMWNPQTPDEFKKLDKQIVEEIGAEYVVAYSSERPANDTKFHAIKVFVTRSDLKARSRRGIYSNLPADSGSAAGDAGQGN